MQICYLDVDLAEQRQQGHDGRGALMAVTKIFVPGPDAGWRIISVLCTDALRKMTQEIR